MKTTFQEKDNHYVMTFEGRLDTAASLHVERDTQALKDCTGHDIILDCSKLEYISSSGLRIFLSLLKNAKAKHSQCTIVGLNSDLRQVFDETGFSRLFNIKSEE